MPKDPSEKTYYRKHDGDNYEGSDFGSHENREERDYTDYDQRPDTMTGWHEEENKSELYGDRRESDSSHGNRGNRLNIYDSTGPVHDRAQKPPSDAPKRQSS